VSAADLWPMFVVCQQMRLGQWRLLAKADPVDSPIGRRMLAAHEVALGALAEGTRTSTELDRLLAAEVGPIDTPVQRIYWRHLAALIPMVHVPHDGEGYGRSRYAVATDWLGVDPPRPEPAEAHAHVARRYLAAFGPATIDDLVAYVGRGRGGIGVWRDAIAALGDEVIELRHESGRTLLDLESAPRPGADVEAPPRLLARWDSLLLSHATKARDRVIADHHRPAVYSKNADVLPTLLIDGVVAGTWDLVRTGAATRVELRPFGRLRQADRLALESEADRMLAIVSPSA
jgi:hypothetical protein